MATRADAAVSDAPKGSLSPVRLQGVVAEFLGSFLIEYVAGTITVGSAGSELVTGALGIGFTFTTVMFIFRGWSGAHMNPAVTIGIMASSPPLAYDFNNIQGLAYILSQVLGNVTGAVVCRTLHHARSRALEDDVDDSAVTGATASGSKAPHQSGSMAFLATGALSDNHGLCVFIFEFICTFAIVWTYFATMIDQKSRKRTGGFGPFAVGLGFIVGVLAEGPGTGGAVTSPASAAPVSPRLASPASCIAGRKGECGALAACRSCTCDTGCCARDPRGRERERERVY